LRLPSSNIWRRIFGALAAGIALGLACYGIVASVERIFAPPPPLAFIVAVVLGLALGVALFVAARVALYLAIYDLRHAAAILLDQPPAALAVPAAHSAQATLRATLVRALELQPAGETHTLVARAITAGPDVSARFTAAVAQIAEHLPISGAALFLYDHEREVLVPSLCWGAVSLDNLTLLPAAEGVLRRVLQHHQDTLLSGAQARIVLPLPGSARTAAAPLLCLPLRDADATVGLLCLIGDERDAAWTERRRELARGFAAQFVLAVQNARLAHAYTLEHEHLNALAALASQLPLNPDLDSSLSHILRTVTSLTGADHGTLLILDRNEQICYRVALTNNNVVPLQLVARSVLRNGLAGWAVRERRSDIIGDTASDRRWVPVPGLSEMRSALVVPLLYGDRVLGVLTLASVRPNHYSPRHLLLASALSTQALHLLALAEQHAAPDEPDHGLHGHLPPSTIQMLRQSGEIAHLATPRTVPVVVLAASIGTFGRLSAQLAPSPLIDQVLNPLASAFAKAVYDHGGYLDCCNGDLSLAVFGYPVATTDAAQQALAAAAQFHEALRALQQPWRALAGYDIVPGTAIASGDITTGRAGAGYVLLGPAIRQAQRLLALARPSEILCSATVAECAGDGFALEPLQPLATLPPAEQPFRLRAQTVAPYTLPHTAVQIEPAHP
jgi:class 3 adenylate cyclase/GAF domain-containing protein